MQLDLFVIPELSTVMPVLLPIAFAVLIAVLSALALLVSKKEIQALPAIIAVIGFAVSILYVYLLGVEVWANDTSTYVWSWAGETFAGPMGVVLAADKLSVVLMGLFTIMGFIVSIYSIGYMKEDTGLTQYYVLLMIMVLSLIHI